MTDGVLREKEPRFNSFVIMSIQQVVRELTGMLACRIHSARMSPEVSAVERMETKCLSNATIMPLGIAAVNLCWYTFWFAPFLDVVFVILQFVFASTIFFLVQ